MSSNVVSIFSSLFPLRKDRAKRSLEPQLLTYSDGSPPFYISVIPGKRSRLSPKSSLIIFLHATGGQPAATPVRCLLVVRRGLIKLF